MLSDGVNFSTRICKIFAQSFFVNLFFKQFFVHCLFVKILCKIRSIITKIDIYKTLSTLI